MTKFVAFLRGINVGGHRKIKMAELKQLHEALGHQNVVTHLQSGNVVFDNASIDRAELIRTIERQYRTDLEIDTHVILRSTDEMQRALNDCPFPPNEEREAKFLHGVFLSETPETDAVSLLLKYQGPELIRIDGDMLYVYYTKGSGNSKFNLSLIEKSLGVRGTARNWNSVTKILALMTN